MQLSLSFPNDFKSFWSIAFFSPVLKYFSIKDLCSQANNFGIKFERFIPFNSSGLYLKIFSISLLLFSIIPSFPLSPFAIIIPVSLLNKREYKF